MFHIFNDFISLAFATVLESGPCSFYWVLPSFFFPRVPHRTGSICYFGVFFAFFLQDYRLYDRVG